MKDDLLLKLLAATVLVLGSLSTAAPAADGQAAGAKAGTRIVTRCGKLLKTDVAQSSMPQSTTSTTFIDVAGSTVSFNIPGTVNTCILVDFSGLVAAPSSLMNIRAVRDTTIVSS